MAASPPSSSTAKVARVFGLEGEKWMRHSNPWSVWTRFTVLPLLVLSIWSRDWIGWFCLIPIALSIVWMFVNPLFFKEPRSTKNWASKGVFGERIWSERDRSTLPEQFDSPLPNVIQALQIVGVVALAYGLIELDALVTITGMLIVQIGKLWYIDRMVLLFDDMKQHEPEYGSWDF